mmetsp:Transcript_47405/g.115436  ORF Transcript_47405/g.115436 Transcript_47405/m.115436 type:complete len:297 (-) Transcript_47405:1114-2004(-)
MHVVRRVQVPNVGHLYGPLQNQGLEAIWYLSIDQVIGVLEPFLQIGLEPRHNGHVLRHVRREHHVDDHLAEGCLLVVRHAVDEVALWLPKDPKCRRQVVVLIGRPVVGVDGPLIACLDEEVVVETLVLEVVDEGCDEGGEELEAANEALHPALGEQHVDRLHHVGHVRRAVVRVVLLPTLDGAQELHQLHVVEVEFLDEVVLKEDVPREDLQGEPVRLLLELEHVEAPLVRALQALPQALELHGLVPNRRGVSAGRGRTVDAPRRPLRGAQRLHPVLRSPFLGLWILEIPVFAQED